MSPCPPCCCHGDGPLSVRALPLWSQCQGLRGFVGRELYFVIRWFLCVGDQTLGCVWAENPYFHRAPASTHNLPITIGFEATPDPEISPQGTDNPSRITVAQEEEVPFQR